MVVALHRGISGTLKSPAPRSESKQPSRQPVVIKPRIVRLNELEDAGCHLLPLVIFVWVPLAANRFQCFSLLREWFFKQFCHLPCHCVFSLVYLLVLGRSVWCQSRGLRFFGYRCWWWWLGSGRWRRFSRRTTCT